MGAPKWQSRHLKLDPSSLSYFANSSSTTPKGVIPLTPGCWVKSVGRSEGRRKDAFMSSQQNSVFSMISNPLGILSDIDGEVERDFVFALHIPKPPMAMIDNMMGLFILCDYFIVLLFIISKVSGRFLHLQHGLEPICIYGGGEEQDLLLPVSRWEGEGEMGKLK